MSKTKARISYRRRRAAVVSRAFNSISTAYTDFTRWSGQKNVKVASPSPRRQPKGGEA